MPSVSAAQHKLMEAAAHTPGGYGGVPQKVGKEFIGKDMTPNDWRGLLRGFVKWIFEEESEPEHADDDASGKLNEKERAEADRDHKEREEMPGSAFLEEASRKYPVKAKRDGEWKYDRDLLLAAAREARMHGHEDLATRADAIRERMKNGANDEMAFDWAIKIEGLTLAPSRSGLAFDRASVRRYDGDDRLHVKATNISKAAVNEYLGSEIPDYQELGLDPDKRYRLYRDPAEIRKGAASFNNLPLLSRHVPVDAQDHRPDLVIGSTGTDAEFDAPYLKNSLVVWAADAIDDIESEIKKELSSAYRYRADMTPGKTPDGEAYDGVMRDIVGNHVALVKQGRAGPDVVVGDSMENLSMSKTVKMTRKAASVLGVLSLHVKPKLAQDAKVSLAPILAKVTRANFKTSKPAIVAALKDATKGKLAKDANLDDVTDLLDALEKADVANGDDEIELRQDPEEAKDAQSGEIREFLKSKLSQEDYDRACKMLGDGGARDEEDEEEKKRREEEDRRKAAQDVEEKVAEKTKDMVSKKAMDEAIQVAVDAERKRQREVREAEEFVRPWVGKIAMAHDSAVGVLQAAAKALSVEDGDKINDATALRAVIKAQPLPGAQQKHAVHAMDAAGEKSFAERFPHAARIKIAS